jgi:hypothetical protein
MTVDYFPPVDPDPEKRGTDDGAVNEKEREREREREQ